MLIAGLRVSEAYAVPAESLQFKLRFGIPVDLLYELWGLQSTVWHRAI